MKFKRLLAMGMATAMAVSILATGASATTGTGSWTISGGLYGNKLFGSSSGYDKVLTGSIKTKIVTASSSLNEGHNAPNLHVSVVGRVNSTTVMSASKTLQNANEVSVEISNLNYGGSNMSGVGYHNVWSSTLVSVERCTYF